MSKVPAHHPMKKPANTETASRSTRLRDGIEILDIENYAPFLLTVVSNAWTRKTGANYRKRFGIGIADWRILSMLNIEPKITANRVCEVLRMDKAAVSRALMNLHEKGFLEFQSEPNDQRKRIWWLSKGGQALHRDVLSLALTYEAGMLDGIGERDIGTFLKVMKKILGNLDRNLGTDRT